MTTRPSAPRTGIFQSFISISADTEKPITSKKLDLTWNFKFINIYITES